MLTLRAIRLGLTCDRKQRKEERKSKPALYERVATRDPTYYGCWAYLDTQRLGTAVLLKAYAGCSIYVGVIVYHATMAYTVALTCFSKPVQRRSDPQGSTKVFVRHVASRVAEEAGDIKPQQRCCRYIFIHMQICIHMQLYETSIASSCGGQVTWWTYCDGR